MGFKFGNVEIFSSNLNIDFMRWRKVSILLSVLLVVASIFVIATRGLNYSIDFLGGTELTVDVGADVSRERVEEIARQADVGTVTVTTYGGVGERNATSYLLRIQREAGANEAETGRQADQVIQVLQQELGAENVRTGSVTSISGKIGDEEQFKGYMALLLAMGAILIYIGFRFDSRFAPGAVLCLLHDVIIAVGVMTALGRPFSVASIAAFLTIVGYSINDTIIIYDRIRETQLISPKTPLVDIVNRSINQMMQRTVFTSGTTVMALLVLTIMGGGAIEDFALTMLIGILVGTYSSIYVAAPLTIVLDNFFISRGWKAKEPVKKAKVERDPNYIPPVIVKRKPPQ